MGLFSFQTVFTEEAFLSKFPSFVIYALLLTLCYSLQGMGLSVSAARHLAGGLKELTELTVLE